MNRSPDRHTFQRDAYIDRCKQDGVEPNAGYIKLYNRERELDLEFEQDTDQHVNNLEYDLRSTVWILEKVRQSDTYAQNLYAAMCNRSFVKNDVWPILKRETWGCSWRYAGGIIADMKQEGDYINWYCSGMGDGLGNGDKDGNKGYVSEGTVTEEIQKDLLKLGWIVLNEDFDDV